HGLPRLRRRRRQGRRRDLPGPPLSRELSLARAPRRGDHPDRVQHADLGAGARPQRALHACGGLRQPLVWVGRRQGGGGGRGRADPRLLHHRSTRPGAREGRDAGRRAHHGADRLRPDGSASKALELPRAATAAALWRHAQARDREGATSMSASGVDVVVRGGRVVTSTDVVEAAVAIRGDKIVAIGPDSLLPKADRVIDATGKLVLPGLIDCHLHVGPEYDDWRTAPLAAARTGLTTLLPFVTYDEGETLPKATARLREEGESLSVLDFGFHFILNHDPYILEGIPEAFRMGVSSIKLFMTYKKRGNRMVSDQFIAQTMEKLADLGGLCQL